MAEYLHFKNSIKSKLALKRVKQLVQKTDTKQTEKSVDEPANTENAIEKDKEVIYVEHNHEIYEDEMRAYFKQVGKITNIKIVRSKTTGRSKGYGFVEFQHPEVAAESTNNCFMFKQVLKAECFPLEKQHPLLFDSEDSSTQFLPKFENRLRLNRLKTKNLSKTNNQLYAKWSINKINKTNVNKNTKNNQKRKTGSD